MEEFANRQHPVIPHIIGQQEHRVRVINSVAVTGVMGGNVMHHRQRQHQHRDLRRHRLLLPVMSLVPIPAEMGFVLLQKNVDSQISVRETVDHVVPVAPVDQHPISRMAVVVHQILSVEVDVVTP